MCVRPSKPLRYSAAFCAVSSDPPFYSSDSKGASLRHKLARYCKRWQSFLFLQANSEVSALLGRIPSAVGYQPTLATDLGALQERITTTDKGSITSVQVRNCTTLLAWELNSC